MKGDFLFFSILAIGYLWVTSCASGNTNTCKCFDEGTHVWIEDGYSNSGISFMLSLPQS